MKTTSRTFLEVGNSEIGRTNQLVEVGATHCLLHFLLVVVVMRQQKQLGKVPGLRQVKVADQMQLVGDGVCKQREFNFRTYDVNASS